MIQMLKVKGQPQGHRKRWEISSKNAKFRNRLVDRLQTWQACQLQQRINDVASGSLTVQHIAFICTITAFYVSTGNNVTCV